MDTDLSRKIVAISVCFGFCLFAQAQGQVSELRLPGEPPEVRLPGDSPPPFALEWGSFGTGDGQFDGPIGVAVDADGNVYVADCNNYRIQKFDGNGTFLTKWGSEGTADGQFSGQSNVAVDSSGNVYVQDKGNYRIQKFNSSGTFITKWGTQGTGDGEFAFMGGLAVDSSGNVYVADSYNYRIQKFDSNGTFITKWGSMGTGDGQFQRPWGLSVDSSGDIYVADRFNHRIQKFDSSGTFLTKWGSNGTGDGQFAYPSYVAADAAGNVYVADTSNQRIQKFDSDGTFITKWGSLGTGDGQFNLPRGVAVNAVGCVYVVDSNNNRVQKFGPVYETQIFIKEWGASGGGDSQFSDPRGPAVDSSGNVYVADRGNQRIQKFDGSGALLMMLGWGVDDGSTAFQTCTNNCQAGISGGGAGQFNSPTDVAVDNSGNIYVADSLNYRIQMFDSTGAFLRTWGWGVDDGSSAFQICTGGCQAGSSGSGDGQLNDAERIDVSSAGDVYVADMSNHRIQEFDSSGNFVRAFGWGVDDGSSALQVCASGCQAGISGSGDGQFSSPEEVAVNISGNIYVTDDNERVQTFNSSASYLSKWGSHCDVATSGVDACDGDFYYPYGLEVDASGNVFVADTSNHRIQKFDNTGTFLTRWGVNGSGEGQFDFPYGVAIDASGNLYVSDANNNRIQKFGPCGFSMTPFSLFFSPGAGSGGFDIDAVTEACGWTATASHSWITLTGAAVGVGDGSVEFSVAANPTAITRGGTIAISDETTGGLGVAFSIIQDPAPCTYGLSSSSASFNGGAGADFVSVTSLLGCPWTAVSNDGWISVDAGAAGNGDGFVLYSVAANAGSTARSGTMTIAGYTFTVDQDPQVPDAPSNLAAAAMNSTKVSLTWTDNAGNETEVRVERKLGAAGTFAQIVALPPDTPGILDSGLERRTTYVYRVMASNSAGCSLPSNEATETTPAFGTFIGEEETAQR